jgi:hypothetical protein
MKKIKQEKGYGVVGTWISPHKLGGTLPLYISDKEQEAIDLASTNSRLLEFTDKSEQWLCEITVTPIRKLSSTSKVIFE